MTAKLAATTPRRNRMRDWSSSGKWCRVTPNPASSWSSGRSWSSKGYRGWPSRSFAVHVYPRTRLSWISLKLWRKFLRIWTMSSSRSTPTESSQMADRRKNWQRRVKWGKRDTFSRNKTRLGPIRQRGPFTWRSSIFGSSTATPSKSSC